MRWADMNQMLATLNGKRGPTPYLISTGLVLISFFIRLALGPLLGTRAPLLPFIVAVVLAAGLYGVGPGLLAIVLGAVLATFAFITPWGSNGATPEQIANIIVFLITGGAMMLFANHLRQTRTRAQKLELELMQAQTTAAMGTMAGTLAHELNQPLAAAANYVAACQQLASLPDRKPQSMVKGLQKAEAQIQRAGEIIRHARKLVKYAPVEREVSSLRRMFRRAIEVLKAGDWRNAKFEMEVLPGADLVAVNSVQIEQVLLNLLRNACQSMLDPRPAEVRLKATATDRGILIEVRDGGAGIPHDRLPTLFSAKKPTASGLGIGLSISRTIVEAHGGNIWAQNNPEGGASFFILLPGAESPGRVNS